jgi:hypothetical protein
MVQRIVLKKETDAEMFKLKVINAMVIAKRPMAVKAEVVRVCLFSYF